MSAPPGRSSAEGVQGGAGSPVIGLSSGEAARRLDEHGPNQAPRAKPRSLWVRVLGQLSDPMILLLCGALLVVIALGDLADAAVIAAVVVLNTTIGVVQELRAERAVAALEDLSAPSATVMRDGALHRVPAPEVVPGDALRLEAGDIVAADASLVEAAGLQVDESAMTGESVPVDRGSEQEVQAGTVVTRGRAVAVVLRTGADSGLGRIAALIAATGLRPTPLQIRLAGLSRLLVVVVLALAAVVLALGLLRGEPLAEMLILSVSLAVAAIPESLPAVVSVALALGAYRMARHSAVVRWLPAVETLGSVTVLASDKTGTLTEGQMVVERLWTPAGVREVTGRGYADEGEIAGPSTDDLHLLLRALVLCNDASLTESAKRSRHVVGDPMEVALLVAARRGGLDLQAHREHWSRVDELPFDSDLRMMATLHRSSQRPPERWLTVYKGAPEILLGRVRASAHTERARALATEWAGQGFRVIAAAQTEGVHRLTDWADSADPPTLLGLVAITDPPRPRAAEVVRACRDAGIRPVLITGDHPATAHAIASRLGITPGPDAGEVERQHPREPSREVEGVGDPELGVADGAMVERGEHVAMVDRISVYARTKPEQKVDIVAAWQARGDVVAMTGDGVNDAPALRRADIGVAMGDRGTEVARQAADLVLADDDLATVVVAVSEGRRIYANIRTFLRYALSGGAAEVAVIMLAPFLGLPIPLAPAQILWINMLTHGVPGVAFGGEPLDKSVMSRPSTSPQQSVLGGGLWRQILTTGALIAAVSLVAAMLAPGREATLQSWVFVTLGLAQLWVALALRAPRRGWAWRSRGLEAAVAVAVTLQILAVTWGPLCDVLSTEPLPWSTLAGLSVLSAVPALVVTSSRHFGGSRSATATTG